MLTSFLLLQFPRMQLLRTRAFDPKHHCFLRTLQDELRFAEHTNAWFLLEQWSPTPLRISTVISGPRPPPTKPKKSESLQAECGHQYYFKSVPGGKPEFENQQRVRVRVQPKVSKGPLAVLISPRVADSDTSLSSPEPWGVGEVILCWLFFPCYISSSVLTTLLF